MVAWRDPRGGPPRNVASNTFGIGRTNGVEGEMGEDVSTKERTNKMRKTSVTEYRKRDGIKEKKTEETEKGIYANKRTNKIRKIRVTENTKIETKLNRKKKQKKI